MRLALLLASLLFGAGMAGAQEVTKIATYKTWTVYEQIRSGARICWISTPAAFVNGTPTAADVHLMVSTGISKGVSTASVASTDPNILAARNFRLRFDVVDMKMRRDGTYLWLTNIDGNNQFIEVLFARSGPGKTVLMQSSRHSVEFASNGMTSAFKKMISRCPQS